MFSGPVKRARVEPRDPESEIMRRMFVGNLNTQTTENELEEYFNKFGQVESVSIKVHADTKRSRGFGFIIFKQSCDVDTALSSRPHTLMGAKLDCKRSTPKSEGVGMEERVKKIWIGKPDGSVKVVGAGLNEDTTDEVSSYRRFSFLLGGLLTQQVPRVNSVCEKNNNFHELFSHSKYHPISKIFF